MMVINEAFKFINLLTSYRYLVMTRSLNVDSTSDSSPVPIPFAPPSEEFCATNTLGDDFYVSLLKPCTFVFFNSSCTSEVGHYTCNDTYDPSDVLSEAQLQLLMWPESCVANGPRYYLTKENPELKNYAFDGNNFNASNYTYEFPEDAVAFSVSCSDDFAAAQETLNGVDGSFSSVFHPFVGMVILFSFLGLSFCVCGVMCCCCCMPICKKSPRRQHYHPESYDYVGKSEAEPLSAAVVV